MSLSEAGPAGPDLFAESTASSHTRSGPAGPASPTAIDTDLSWIVGRTAPTPCSRRVQVNLPTRIRHATCLRAGDLSIYALLRTYNQENKVLIRIKAANRWIFSGWWSSGRWRDQSQLLTYWGPEKADTKALEVLTTACKARTVEPSAVKELIEIYLLSQLDESTAIELRGKIDEQTSSEISVSNFVDGESEITWGGALGLASAQNLATKISRQASLSSAEINSLRLLLTEAPLQFGYWGPFKTALKSLAPAALPAEFGIALARLSTREDSASAPTEIEDLSWMSAFMEVPTNETRQYMSKRMRRQLAKVGDTNPSLYTEVAASMLQRWDKTLDPFSYLPAYVIGGDQTVLNDTGRCVSLPLDQSSRRDAHPSAWDSHRDRLRELLPQIRVSVETFTFASKVLLAADEELPELQANQLILALSSTDPRLVARTCSAVPLLSDQWTSLRQEHWETFLSQAEVDTLRQVLGPLSHSSSLPRAMRAAIDLLASSEKYSLLNTKEQERSQLISEFYIAAITIPENNLNFYADFSATAAALLTLGCSLPLEEQSDLWEARLKQLSSYALMEAYQKLSSEVSTPPGNLETLERALVLSENNEYQLHQLVLQAMEIRASRAVALGWRLFDRCENDQDLLADLWQLLGTTEAPEAFTSQGWQERRLELLGPVLARSVDIPTRINDLISSDVWNLNATAVASLILASPDCLRAIWSALASNEEDQSVDLRTVLEEQKSLVLAIGDRLLAEDLSGANQSQQELLLNYVNACDRVSVDYSFAVAAVALGEPNLQHACLEQLRNSNTLQKCWLQLAELGLPIPLRTVRVYLNKLETTSAFTDAVLACVDSIVPIVRDLGLELIGSDPERIEHDRLWPALTQSDDPVVQALVAKESLQRTWTDSQGLAAFDRRLLVSRRSNRRAKIQVQSRLSGDQLLAPERRAALLDLARGATGRDREWALRQIAELTLQGVPFDDVALRQVTTTDDAGGQN